MFYKKYLTYITRLALKPKHSKYFDFLKRLKPYNKELIKHILGLLNMGKLNIDNLRRWNAAERSKTEIINAGLSKEVAEKAYNKFLSKNINIDATTLPIIPHEEELKDILKTTPDPLVSESSIENFNPKYTNIISAQIAKTPDDPIIEGLHKTIYDHYQDLLKYVDQVKATGKNPITGEQIKYVENPVTKKRKAQIPIQPFLKQYEGFPEIQDELKRIFINTHGSQKSKDILAKQQSIPSLVGTANTSESSQQSSEKS